MKGVVDCEPKGGLNDPTFDLSRSTRHEPSKMPPPPVVSFSLRINICFLTAIDSITTPIHDQKASSHSENTPGARSYSASKHPTAIQSYSTILPLLNTKTYANPEPTCIYAFCDAFCNPSTAT